VASSDVVITAVVTVSSSGTEWLRPPFVPVTVAEVLPPTVDPGTVSDTVWLAPAATVNGADGDVVLAVGRPVGATATAPLNPFCAVIDTVNVEGWPPACSVTTLGDTEITKSGLRVGGGGTEGVDPPPQPVNPIGPPKMHAAKRSSRRHAVKDHQRAAALHGRGNVGAGRPWEHAPAVSHSSVTRAVTSDMKPNNAG
jgi:hypothetical protein